MIGPHEGKELELMLAGEKPIAFFHDINKSGHEIVEEVIPEAAFSKYVEEGKFIRLSEDIFHARSGDTIKCVFFFHPQEEWRAQTILWIKNQIYSGYRSSDDCDDIIIGRLLGYKETDIQHFLSHQNSQLSSLRRNLDTGHP